MPLILTNIAISDRAELRQLILSSMETLFSSFQILDLEAPLPGEPILLLNQDKNLIVVSFDVHDGGNALVNGLLAAEKILREEALFKRLYPALKQQAAGLYKSTKLFLLTPVDIMNEVGHSFLNEKVSIYTFRGIGVNGETTLMIEPLKQRINYSTDDVSPASANSVKDVGSVTNANSVTNDTRESESHRGNETDGHPISSEFAEMSADELLFFQQL